MTPAPIELVRHRLLAVLIAVVLAAGLATVQARADAPVDPAPRWAAVPLAREYRASAELSDADKPGFVPPAASVAPPEAAVPTLPEAPPPPPPEAPPPPESPPAAVFQATPREPRLAAFSGLSSWVDLYDVEATPHDQVAVAANAGVQTLFVQSARFNSPTDLHDPARLGTLIEAAHDAGLRVLVWYIPDFLDPARDLYRAQVAAAFVTPRGDRPDALGLDIEVDDLADVAERDRRLLDLSAQLRAWAGPDYPLAAIVLPPLQLEVNQDWWPGFPYAELRPHYDVFIPMSYSSYRGQDATTTYDWNVANIHDTRRLAGDAELPVHLAGGIADQLPEVGAFVAAATDGGAIGAGLYDLDTTPAASWPLLLPLRR